MRFKREAAGTPERDRLVVGRFRPPGARPALGRVIGATVAVVALLGSLAAATLGPAFGEALPYPLLVLLMLTRG